MITGFNTDIEFEGVVYHIQTEDKGLATPVILSLVYDGGTILASKRLRYDDLLTGEFDEKLLTERVQKQHKLICAAVRRGRIEELKKMSGKKSPLASISAGVEKEVELTASNGHQAASINEEHAPGSEAETEIATDNLSSLAPNAELPIPKPNQVTVAEFEQDYIEAEPIVAEIEIIEDETILPAEAVEIIGEFIGTQRPANNKLSLDFIGDSTFKGGERKTVGIMVCRGSERKVVDEAQIMVKILGSSFRPLIFHARTDGNGIAKVHLQLPHFQSGRAAILVRAMSKGEEVELRRSVSIG